ncbi:1,4-alpha-glucan branching protein GlgB [Cardiobacteriaceae bacterium TAE3-ERU3]|nr:1,4-alpha-glucan branching protein GlgB [Cardiobacteriaceae bacterium TAE3-ERU3]
MTNTPENLIADGYHALDGAWLETEPEVYAALSAMLSEPPAGAFLTTLSVTANTQANLTFPFAASENVSVYDEQGHLLTTLPQAEDGCWKLPPLAMGYYTLRSDAGQVCLIAAPRRTFEHPVLAEGKRLSGVTLQLYSLRSERNWGIGDFADLDEVVENFAAKGVDFIGINPLHALFGADPEGASPYSPASRYWLNPVYLDVDNVAAFRASEVAQKWWQGTETQRLLKQARDGDWVDYTAVWTLKNEALSLAWETFCSDDRFNDERDTFAAFCTAHGRSLQHFALFQALDNHFASTSGWLGWPEEYRDVNSDAVAAFIKEHQDAIDYRCWLQWLLHQRLGTIQRTALKQGMSLGLYGDVAVGAARGSADVWFGREQYALDASIGAPPDAFTPLGQNWQLPPLNPRIMLEDGCAAWQRLLHENMRHYGVLRIDHVMALYRLWWVAFGESAAHGAYVHYPIEQMMAILALESQRAKCVVIGEDLGIVPPEVRTLLDEYGVYTYKVAYFEQDSMPDEYPSRSLATLGTHDLPPLAGYLRHTDLDVLHQLMMIDDEGYRELTTARKQELQHLLRIAESSDEEDNQGLHIRLMQALAIGGAQLVSVQLENLFGISASSNIPGVVEGYRNWRLKMPAAVSSLQDGNLWHTISAARRTAEEVTMAHAISDYDRHQIDNAFFARLQDPFSWLGVHHSNDGAIARILAPGAERVHILTDDHAYALKQVDDRGFFIGCLPHWTNTYRLHITRNGESISVDDPYRFTSALSEYDLWLLGEGQHLRPYEQLGAHPMAHQETAGVRFAVWAPNAQRISVVGDFNGWDGRIHSMRKHSGSGVWDIFIPDVELGAKYKFELLDANGAIRLKADPYAFAAELRPDTASIVRGLPPKVEVRAEREHANQRDAAMSTYEVHLGSWRRNTENHYWLNYDQIADELIPYVQEMGFTHIELLPISEFPFDGSWGYQATGLYAPTARFGDPEGLRRLIARAHDAGIGVLLDWVVGHFPTDDYGLALFDGTHLYEHADPREGYHQDWNTLIYNFGRNEVRNFLVGSALYWIERFGFDGLRVDAVASMIYRDYSRKDGEWIPNQYGGRENLEAIDFLRRTNAVLHEQCPQAMVIAEESTSFPGVTHSSQDGGLGFTFKWNMGWMNDSLRYMQLDPIYRQHEHHLMTFAMAYQYSESFVLPLSHDEVVHGKRSLIGRMPGDCWQQFANLRAYYGFMWGHPGKKLLFMGDEFAQGREWNEDDSLDWFLLSEEHGPWHRGMQRWVADLNAVYQNHSALFAGDDDPSGFQWRVVDDNAQSVFAFERIHGNQRLLIVVNMTPVVRNGYRIGVGAAGAYREILNSDADIYAGSGQVGNGGIVHTDAVPAHHAGQSLELNIPALGALYFLHESV